MNIEFATSSDTKQALGLPTNFPYPLAVISGERALEKLVEIEANHPGMTPVLIGSPDFAEELAENLASYETPPAEVLKQAETVDLAEWSREREAEIRECYENESDWPLGDGIWPEEIKPSTHFKTAIDMLTDEPLQQIVVALLPTSNAWEVNAYLQYGGWNECPMPEFHCAMAKRWWQECGAYIASVNGASIEYRVLRPIRDGDQALAIAKEQFIYCMDIVDQGTVTIEALAKALLDSTVWYFWWD